MKSVKGQGFWPQVQSDGPVGANRGTAACSRLWVDPTADVYSLGDSITVQRRLWPQRMNHMSQKVTFSGTGMEFDVHSLNFSKLGRPSFLTQSPP